MGRAVIRGKGNQKPAAESFTIGGNLERGFARVRCDHCRHEASVRENARGLPKPRDKRAEKGWSPGHRGIKSAKMNTAQKQFSLNRGASKSKFLCAAFGQPTG